MKSETRALFDAVPRTFYAPEMKGMTVSYRFEIEDGDQWTIRVVDGNVTVAEASPGDPPASCSIKASDADMALCLRGRQNILTALLQGRLAVVGDLAAAQRLRGLLFAFGAGRREAAEERSPTP
jgi:putative sterol carrier protein